MWKKKKELKNEEKFEEMSIIPWFLVLSLIIAFAISQDVKWWNTGEIIVFWFFYFIAFGILKIFNDDVAISTSVIILIEFFIFYLNFNPSDWFWAIWVALVWLVVILITYLIWLITAIIKRRK